VLTLNLNIFPPDILKLTAKQGLHATKSRDILPSSEGAYIYIYIISYDILKMTAKQGLHATSVPSHWFYCIDTCQIKI
jgi:hypothetical protein